MNERTKDTLNDIFNVAPTPTDTPTELVPAVEVLPMVASAPPVEMTEEEKLARQDFEFSRGAIKSVAAEVQNTLHRAVEVAEQTDTPRSFEAVAELARATLESHRELQNLHKVSAEIRIATRPPAAANQVNIDKGIVFSGGADELLRLIDPTRK